MVNLQSSPSEDDQSTITIDSPQQQMNPRPILHRCISLSSSVDPPRDMMRESDAEILEMGVGNDKKQGDFENGRRSVMRSESFHSLTEEDECDPPATLPATTGSIRQRKTIMPQIDEDRNVSSSHSEEKEEDEDEDHNVTDYFVADIDDRGEQQVDTEAVMMRIASGRVDRSDSFERRSRESAQFAEAVGENFDLLLNKIIEEDSSSDFDDDDIDQVEGDVGEEKEEEIEEKICVDKFDDERVVLQSSPIHQVSTTYNEPSTHSTPEATPLEKSIVQSIRISSLAPLCPYVDWKFTRQYSSSNAFALSSRDLTDKSPNLSSNDDDESLGYRGIRSSLLEITQRGVSRGNYAQLHRKAWLEVSDKYHRYGKNLRMYYKHWEGLGHPFHMFFDWLDSKGEADGAPLPNLPECPRSVLDADTVLYITNPEVSATYAMEIVVDPADGSAIVLDRDTKRPVLTGKEGWIFVLRDHVMYGSQKVICIDGGFAHGSLLSDSDSDFPLSMPRQRFHHSSFFGGKAVASAGIFLTDDQGRLTDLWPHSGHYRPGEAHMQRALFFLQQLGVDLSTFDVDMQQIFKVCRKKSPKDGSKKKDNTLIESNSEEQPQSKEGGQSKKAKKTDCILNMCGFEVACFLAHKARTIEKGVFHQIHKIRKLPHESRSNVRAVLDYVN